MMNHTSVCRYDQRPFRDLTANPDKTGPEELLAYLGGGKKAFEAGKGWISRNELLGWNDNEKVSGKYYDLAKKSNPKTFKIREYFAEDSRTIKGLVQGYRARTSVRGRTSSGKRSVYINPQLKACGGMATTVEYLARGRNDV